MFCFEAPSNIYGNYHMWVESYVEECGSEISDHYVFTQTSYAELLEIAEAERIANEEAAALAEA
jgi:hypothetical protein